jgi:myo-inositol-1(or 4)-monophosphatase
MHPPSDLLKTAIDAAEAAAAVHASFHGKVRTRDATEKGASDFVSHVDLQAQEAALDVIRARFPDHGIMSEEAPTDAPDPEADENVPLWVVDPLDGTTNFLHGHPAYAASVGVVVGGRPTAGAVVASATDERWWASLGEGAFRNGRAIRVSELRELRTALIGTGFPFKRMSDLPSFLRDLERVLPVCAGVRRGGSASLDLCYLAQGSLDAFWEITLDPWDVAAGLVILEEAGGLSSRMDGSALDARVSGSVLAANSAELLEGLGRLLESRTT